MILPLYCPLLPHHPKTMPANSSPKTCHEWSPWLRHRVWGCYSVTQHSLCRMDLFYQIGKCGLRINKVEIIWIWCIEETRIVFLPFYQYSPFLVVKPLWLKLVLKCSSYLNEEERMILESSDNLSFSVPALKKFKIYSPGSAVSGIGSLTPILVEKCTLK